MHRNIFLYSPAGQTIPQAVIDAVTKEYNSCVGGATVNDGVVEDYAVTDGVDLENFKTTVEQMKDDAVLFALGKYEKGFSQEDAQPFTLIKNKEGNPILVAFLDGDFSNHVKSPQNHSDAYVCCQSFLLPLVNELYSDVGEDPDKLLGELKTKMFEKTMRGLGIGDKNVILLLHGSGELLDFCGPAHQKFPFEGGWASAKIPFSAQTAPPDQPAPKLNKFGKPIRSTSVPESGQPSGMTKTIQDLNNSTATKAPPPKSVVQKWGRWPATRADKNAIKNWIAKFAHDPLAKYNFSERPLLRLKDDFDIEALHPKTGRKQADDYEERVVHGMEALERIVQQKEEKKEVAPTPAPEPEKDAPAPTLPLIPVPDKERVVEAYTDAESTLRKVIDTHAKTVLDPEEEQKKFEKIPDFAQELGMEWDEILRWEWDAYKVLGQESNTALAKLAFSLRHMLVQEMNKNKKPSVTAPSTEVRLNKFGKPIKQAVA